MFNISLALIYYFLPFYPVSRGLPALFFDWKVPLLDGIVYALARTPSTPWLGQGDITIGNDIFRLHLSRR